MRFESARDALKHAKEFHQQLGKFFEDLAMQENTPRIQLLLEYMIGEEKSLTESLAQYEKDTPSGVIDTWLQYANDQEILKLPMIADFQAKISMDDILALSMEMSDELIALYKSVLAQVNEHKVKEIFNNLADMQLQKQKRISMNFDRFMDI